jgi:hypothetical protein
VKPSLLAAHRLTLWRLQITSHALMSSSINVDSLNNVPEFAKIIINSFVNGTRVAFIGLILGLIYSALLIPLLFSLFFFSTSKIRRQPIFLFVTTIVLIGIGIGIWVVYLVVSKNLLYNAQIIDKHE